MLTWTWSTMPACSASLKPQYLWRARGRVHRPGTLLENLGASPADCGKFMDPRPAMGRRRCCRASCVRPGLSPMARLVVLLRAGLILLSTRRCRFAPALVGLPVLLGCMHGRRAGLDSGLALSLCSPSAAGRLGGPLGPDDLTVCRQENFDAFPSFGSSPAVTASSMFSLVTSTVIAAGMLFGVVVIRTVRHTNDEAYRQPSRPLRGLPYAVVHRRILVHPGRREGGLHEQAFLHRIDSQIRGHDQLLRPVHLQLDSALRRYSPRRIDSSSEGDTVRLMGASSAMQRRSSYPASALYAPAPRPRVGPQPATYIHSFGKLESTRETMLKQRELTGITMVDPLYSLTQQSSNRKNGVFGRRGFLRKEEWCPLRLPPPKPSS